MPVWIIVLNAVAVVLVVINLVTAVIRKRVSSTTFGLVMLGTVNLLIVVTGLLQ